MQDPLHPDPLFISIESINHYFQRKEKVLCIGALLDRFQSSKLNPACLYSSCTFHLVSCVFPCFISKMLWRGIPWGMPLFSVVGRVVHSQPHSNKGVSVKFSKLLMPGMLCFPTELLTKSLLYFSYWLCTCLPYHSTNCLASPKLGGQYLLGCIPGHWTSVPP